MTALSQVFYITIICMWDDEEGFTVVNHDELEIFSDDEGNSCYSYL